MLVAENMSKEEMVKEAVEEAKAKAYKEAERPVSIGSRV